MTLNCKNAYIYRDTNSHALYHMRKQCKPRIPNTRNSTTKKRAFHNVRKYICSTQLIDCKYTAVMYQSNRSFNIPPGIPRAFDAFSCPGGREFDHHSWGVGNLITSLDVTLRDKSWRRLRRRQTLMNSKQKIAYLWQIG